MRIVLQRVRHASVTVAGEVVGAIEKGLLALVAVERGDGKDEIEWCARKTAELRIFPDDDGRMNRDVRETGGDVLAVSQFTLAANIRKGRRPSFTNAASPEEGKALFDRFCGMLRSFDLTVPTGRFGAMMDVELVNEGPVTFVIERRGAPGA